MNVPADFPLNYMAAQHELTCGTPDAPCRTIQFIVDQLVPLGGGGSIKVAAGTWHTLAVKMVGDQIDCSLDGKKYLDAKDDAIAKPGKIGLWTKADSVIEFDDLTFEGR